MSTLSISTDQSQWKVSQLFPVERKFLAYGAWNEAEESCSISALTVDDLPALNTDRFEQSFYAKDLMQCKTEFCSAYLFKVPFFERAVKEDFVRIDDGDFICTGGLIADLAKCTSKLHAAKITAKQVKIHGKAVIILSPTDYSPVGKPYTMYGLCFEDFMGNNKDLPFEEGQPREGQNYVVSELRLRNCRLLIRSEVDYRNGQDLVEVKCDHVIEGNYLSFKAAQALRKAYLATVNQIVYSGIQPKEVEECAKFGKQYTPKLYSTDSLIEKDQLFARGLQLVELVCKRLSELFAEFGDLVDEISCLKKEGKEEITFEGFRYDGKEKIKIPLEST
ncbi:hypothetical protein QR680_014360 [Steinernema hermaphroditum]|uniref:Uncharacterized protein n=1 Tax=Steinernema hermaphroditum TaxID=289476 RepID=A0AA39I8M9_9BILA|nr:hypothetical protein QR680_014360 [Steinernema hermaphroditum]